MTKMIVTGDRILTTSRASSVSRTFTSCTLLGFKVEYTLSLLCERIDEKGFRQARKCWSPTAQAKLADAYNEEVFVPFWNTKSRFFFLEGHVEAENGKPFDVVPRAGELERVWDDGAPVPKTFLPGQLKMIWETYQYGNEMAVRSSLEALN